MTSALSTEYIHFTANSIALRQFSTQAEGSMGRMRSAETATGAKEENCGSEVKMSKLVTLITYLLFVAFVRLARVNIALVPNFCNCGSAKLG